MRARGAWGRDTYPALDARPGWRTRGAPLGGWPRAIREEGHMYSIVYIVGAVVIVIFVLKMVGLY
jgi:hypothetical protein